MLTVVTVTDKEQGPLSTAQDFLERLLPGFRANLVEGKKLVPTRAWPNPDWLPEAALCAAMVCGS